MLYNGIRIGFIENHSRTHVTSTTSAHLSSLHQCILGISPLDSTSSTIFQVIRTILPIWNVRSSHRRLPPTFRDPYIDVVTEETTRLPHLGTYIVTTTPTWFRWNFDFSRSVSSISRSVYNASLTIQIPESRVTLKCWNFTTFVLSQLSMFQSDFLGELQHGGRRFYPRYIHTHRNHLSLLPTPPQ
jgi:hypothetical protein